MDNGQPISHGGDRHKFALQLGCTPDALLDFSANMNPLGPPPWLREVIDGAISEVLHYPDPHLRALTNAAAVHWGLKSETLVWGNGVSQLLFHLPYVLQVGKVLIPTPCYSDYSRAFSLAGFQVCNIPRRDDFSVNPSEIEAQLPNAKVMILGNPNNPDGGYLEERHLHQWLERFPNVQFVVDEAFIDFCPHRQGMLHTNYPNVIVLRSLTKFFCIPGLRLGVAKMPSSLADQLRQRLPPWSVNSLAQAVGIRCFQDTNYRTQSLNCLAICKEELLAQLATLPNIKVHSSEANYLLLELLQTPLTAKEFARKLLASHIMVRSFPDEPRLCQKFIRVAVRSVADNRRLIKALRMLLPHKSPSLKFKRKTPALMVLGTASNVGKSLMAAAFCRIMLQDGYAVAPFKAQNMSNNAYVTRAGDEMGRAQALQAMAARLDPAVEMNPVLLKPSGAKGSQLIIMGKAEGTLNFKAYQAQKKRMQQAIHHAYGTLATNHQAIILEGAGSPAEVNLMATDVVNLAMAHHAQAGVVLVGDIDRGGVFAALLGTMNIFSEKDRGLVLGYLLNRFRGDASMLKPAMNYMHSRTGKRVLGVVPHLNALNLPEEDSVNFKNGTFGDDLERADDCLDLAVIDLPHISNLSDLNPLDEEGDVCLRLVITSQDLGNPDAILLIGSKNVAFDTEFLHQSGLAKAIQHLAIHNPTELVGICGGLQMLGTSIQDPNLVEASDKQLRGLGLLPITTVFKRQKMVRQTKAIHLPTNRVVCGYEIHHGRSDWGNTEPIVTSQDGEILGVRHPQIAIWGTYLHGIFDNDSFRHGWLDGLRKRTGKGPVLNPRSIWNLEPGLNRLADAVRDAVNMKALYRAIGLS